MLSAAGIGVATAAVLAVMLPASAARQGSIEHSTLEAADPLHGLSYAKPSEPAPSTKVAEPVSNPHPDGFPWQTEFTLVANQIEASYPNDYTIAFVNPDGISGVIAFRGAVPDGVAERIAAIPNVELTAYQGYTASELTNYTIELFDHGSARAFELKVNLGVGSDHETMTITATIGPAPIEGSGTTVDQYLVQEAIEDFVRVRPPPQGFTVVFEHTDDASSHAAE